MKAPYMTGMCMAVALSWSLGAGTPSARAGEPKVNPGSATTTDEDDDPNTTTTGTPTSRDNLDLAAQRERESEERTVTMTGCVRKETDVLGESALALGKDDEFVLTAASESGAPSDATGSGAAGAGSTSAEHAPQSADTTVYSLTGEREDDFERLVGRRVEVTGTLEQGDVAGNMAGGVTTSGNGPTGSTGTSGSAADGTASAGTSGSTASDTARSRNATVAAINVTSVREVSGSCSPGDR